MIFTLSPIVLSICRQNKTQSDSTDKMLELQGVSWITRRVIQMGTITLHINHHKDDGGVEHIDIDQALTGLPSTTERRTLDWTSRDHEDHIFGAVIAKSRRSMVENISVPFLRKGWLLDDIEHGLIESYAESDTPKSKMTWNVSQVPDTILALSSTAHHLSGLGISVDRRSSEVYKTNQIHWSQSGGY
jgi:hypothetical protein